MLTVALFTLWGGGILSDCVVHAADPEFKSTYHSIGIEWKPTNPGDSCRVEYKKATDSAYTVGHDLWFDYRTTADPFYPEPPLREMYRGSIVELEPGTDYDIRLIIYSNGIPIETAECPSATTVGTTTWPEEYKLESVEFLPALSDTYSTDGSGLPTWWRYFYMIDDGGTDDGNGNITYKLYTFDPSVGEAFVDAYGLNDNETPTGSKTCGILIKASNVIVRGINVYGGTAGIKIAEGVENVIIEDCNIYGWGREWQDGIGTEDAAIWIGNDTYDPDDFQETERIVVQGNHIHDPRWASTWVPELEHTKGAVGIFCDNVAGNNVFRYNAFYGSGTDPNYMQDAICGASNFSYYGSPGANSDIYRNYITHITDDGIESEGGNRNVRIWGNFISETNTCIALATTSIGPVYVWRNIGYYATSNFIKLANSAERLHLGDGKIYLYHNTVLQPIRSGELAGCKAGIFRCQGELVGNVFSRNNIWEICYPWTTTEYSISLPGSNLNNSLYYDICDGVVWAYPNAEECAEFDYAYNAGEPVPPIKERWEAEYYAGNTVPALSDLRGLFYLSPSSIGYDEGQKIPNFNDDMHGVKPDVGAHEYNSGYMTFGPDCLCSTYTFVLKNGLNGYAGNEDAEISELAARQALVLGDQPQSYLVADYDAATPGMQVLQKFDVSCLQDDAVIESALLDIYHAYSFPQNGIEVTAYPMNSVWDESVVCWIVPYTGGTWSPDLATDLANPVDTFTSLTGAVAGECMTFEIKDAVTDWLGSAFENDKGIVLIEQNGDFLWIYNSETSTDDYRPTLTITYSVPVGSFDSQ